MGTLQSIDVNTKSGIRRPFPYINSIRSFAMDEMLRRKNTYPAPVSSPFVRMTSTKEDKEIGYRFFSLGLHGYDSIDGLFDLTYGRDGDVVGYAYSLSDIKEPDNTKLRKKLLRASDLTIKIPTAEETDLMKQNPTAEAHLQEIQSKKLTEQQQITSFGTQPIPGITSMNIIRRGIGMPIQAQVTWTCYNRQQLEFLRNHFMIAGSYIVLEWGHNFPERQISSALDFSDQKTILDELANCVNKGRNYIIDTFVQPNNGNYDLLVGLVSNFNVEIDAHHNIYTITTTVVSVGEQYWGLSSHTTSVDPEQNAGSITTIHDFFYGDNSEFMRLCSITEAQSNLVAYVHAESLPNSVVKSIDLGSIGNASEDYTFINWNYFLGVIIPKMIDCIQNKEARILMNQFLASTALMDLTDKTRKGEVVEGVAYIGDSPELVSCRPETMIIVRNNKVAQVAEFNNGGYFGNDKFGILGDGIWLNAGAVRRSFLSSQTFDQGVRNLLMEMNLAVAGFWNLRLFFDEDTSELKIIDEKFGSLEDKVTMYKFNVGSKSELLSLNLESAFPPELTTQLSLIASFQSQTKENRLKLLKDMPLIGTTSHFAFALNWTNLIDILQPKLGRNPIDQKDLPNTEGIRSVGTADSGEAALAARVRLGNRIQTPIIVQSANDESAQTAAGVKLGADSLSTADTGNEGPPPEQMQVASNVPGRELPISKTDQIKFRKLSKYDESIKKWADHYQVPAGLIKAIIIGEGEEKAEKAINPNQIVHNPTLANRLKADPAHASSYVEGDENAYGLAGILGDTAKKYGYKPSGLNDTLNNITTDSLGIPVAPSGYYDQLISNPDEQIRLCANILSDMINSPLNKAASNPERLKNAISAYNGYFRPTQGYGSVWKGVPGETGTCSMWSTTESNKCLPNMWNEPVKGQYGNQRYVNKVWTHFTQILPELEKNQTQNNAGFLSTYFGATEGNIVTQQSLKQDQAVDTSEQVATSDREQEILQKYGAPLASLVASTSTELIRRLIKEGLNRNPPSNNFVAPFPTSAAVEMNLLGLAGYSVSDAFLVDKLPFIYEDYGCFQITEIVETVAPEGWITKLRGYFKLMWLDGGGISIGKEPTSNRKSVVY